MLDADIEELIAKYGENFKVYNPETAKPKIAEIIVSKHRNGAIGKAELAWLGEYTKFASLAYDGKNRKEG